jgi:hypothetical protein
MYEKVQNTVLFIGLIVFFVIILKMLINSKRIE